MRRFGNIQRCVLGLSASLIVMLVLPLAGRESSSLIEAALSDLQQGRVEAAKRKLTQHLAARAEEDVLQTQTFRVPPGFFVAARDKSIRQILEGVGVSFPLGSSTVNNPTTGQLIVRNSQANLDLTEAYLVSPHCGVANI